VFEEVKVPEKCTRNTLLFTQKIYFSGKKSKVGLPSKIKSGSSLFTFELSEKIADFLKP
jgi:hypothetical protein